ncbi:MAG: SPOR domain-containing protein [Pseudomonadota bacterium]
MYPDGGEALMADVEFSHNMGAYGRDMDEQALVAEPSTSLTTWTNIAGAAVSLALIAGVGVWGYKLMVRDVSGIPIVRAATTEMRVRPEDPGGQLARHQGLAVNEIAARGTASGPVQQVVLAPPAVALAQEDQPVIAAPVVQPEPLAPAASAFAGVPRSADAAPDRPTLSTRLQQGAIDEVVADLMGESLQEAGGPKTVQSRSLAASDLPTPQPAVVRDQTLALEVPGVRQSVRPRLRPAGSAASLRQAAFTAPEETREINPDAIPSGTRLAQLGAFDSAEVARTEWDRMQRSFGAILDGKSRVVQQAQSGGRTFYRLRAMGFVDLSDTRRFCSAVKAEGVDCIPVQVK